MSPKTQDKFAKVCKKWHREIFLQTLKGFFLAISKKSTVTQRIRQQHGVPNYNT